MTDLRSRRGASLLLVLFSIVILSTALMAANGYLQYRCSRIVRMHHEHQALNLAESGISYARYRIDRGLLKPGSPLFTLDMSGGSVTVAVGTARGRLQITSTGTIGGSSRTVVVTGNMRNGRFFFSEWK
ncbi:hypothetical protein ACFLU6_10970 [Acidobacteriota bacterium]